MGVVVALDRDAPAEDGPRPLDVLRDLQGIGALLDLVFVREMEAEGAQWRQDLALLSMTSPFIWVLRRVSSEMRDALDGFVWTENGRIVGNVTLTREDPSRPVWIISNVAVHPDFRRRGIARTLMQECIASVRQRGGGFLALEVEAGNNGACELYSKLGFRRVDGSFTARRSAWDGRETAYPAEARVVRPDEWRKLYILAWQAQAAAATDIAPVREASFRPTLGRRLQQVADELLEGRRRLWLAVEEEDRFLAAADVTRLGLGGGHVSFTVHPHGRGRVEEPIVQAVLAAYGRSRGTITARADSDEVKLKDVLESCGFTVTRVLQRMLLRV